MDCTLGEGVLVPQPALGRKSPSSRQVRKYGIWLLLRLFPLHFSSLKALRSPAVNLFSSFLVFIFELRCQFFRKVVFLTSGKFDPQPTRTCAILLLCSFPPRYLTHLVTVYLFCDLKKKNQCHFPYSMKDSWGWAMFTTEPLVLVQSQSRTLCGPIACSTPGFPVLHHLPELAQTHVHRVGDAIQPSHPLSSLSPPVFNLSQHHVFSSESALHIRWPMYWSFSFSISPSSENSGLISFRIDRFDLAV